MPIKGPGGVGGSDALIARVQSRMRQELGGLAGQRTALGPSGPGGPRLPPGGPQPPSGPSPSDDFPAEPYAPERYRRRNRQRRPSGVGDMRARIREAVNQDPPKLIWATYKARGASDYKPRYLACYSERDRGEGGAPLLYAACSADSWAIEAFRYDAFADFQVTETPWPFPPQYRIEFADGG